MNGFIVTLLWLLGLAVVINVVALVDYRRRSRGTHHK
jgi:putative exporter of polyketide antibiotics